MGKIYKLTNLINDKGYVGQTTQKLQKRWYRHTITMDTVIGTAIQKHGKENFKVEVIAEAPSIDDLNLLEPFYIQKFKTMVPYGYNVDPGGRNCLKSKESIEKGAAKKRGMAYKGRRRGVIATHSETGQVIEVEVVLDFMKHGFSKSNCGNIRYILSGKSKRKRVKKWYFRYRDQANQNLIVENKESTAVQRIEDETANAE